MKLLIVIDAQNDFITGALKNEEAIKRVPNIVEEIRHTDADVIIATQDTHFSDYLETQEGKRLPVPHCIKGTPGWKIEQSVQDALDERGALRPIEKISFGYPYWNKGMNYDEIELIGFCTDICLISNAMILKAICPEARIYVKESCCAGVTPETHKNALEAMKMCQIDVI